MTQDDIDDINAALYKLPEDYREVILEWYDDEAEAGTHPQTILDGLWQAIGWWERGEIICVKDFALVSEGTGTIQ